MRKILSLVPVLALSAGVAFAGSCPGEMKKIDEKLASKPTLTKEQMDKVSKLRSEGESMHKAGKHAESMKALGEAKKILGI